MPFIESTSTPFCLAILETDKPLPSIASACGNSGAIFTSLFQAASQSLDPSPQRLESQVALSTYDVLNGDPKTAYPDPEIIDAVLITGSRYSAYENQDWILRIVKYTRRLLEGGRVQVISICFGQQIAARALGAKVARSPRGWEMAIREVGLIEEGKKVSVAKTLVGPSQ